LEVAEWCYGAPAATVGDYNNNNEWNIDYSNRQERDVEIDNKTAAIPTDGETNQWAKQCYPDGWKWIFYYVDRQQQMAGLLQQLLQKQADLRPRTEQPAFYDSMNATSQAMLKVVEGLRTISGQFFASCDSHRVSSSLRGKTYALRLRDRSTCLVWLRPMRTTTCAPARVWSVSSTSANCGRLPVRCVCPAYPLVRESLTVNIRSRLQQKVFAQRDLM